MVTDDKFNLSTQWEVKVGIVLSRGDQNAELN